MLNSSDIEKLSPIVFLFAGLTGSMNLKSELEQRA